MYNQALSLTYEISVIRFIPTHSGLIFCESTNKFGSTIENASIILSDIEKPFLITGYSEDQPITLGDDITLNCSCTIYNCNLVTWFLNDRPIKRQEGRVSLYESATSFSYSHTLNFKNISKDDSGLYQCNAGHENSTVETLEIFLMVNDPEPPVVFAIPNETVVQIKHNENYFCRCKASGLPIPKITWYKVCN